jgi:DNA-binding CsgD family transcriptional regulator
LGVDELTIAKYRRAAGLRAHQPGAVAPELEREIAKRFERGQSRLRIARELNVSYYQVRKVARGTV